MHTPLFLHGELLQHVFKQDSEFGLHEVETCKTIQGLMKNSRVVNNCTEVRGGIRHAF